MLERLNTSSSLPFTYLGRDSIGVPGRQCIQDLLNVPFSLGSESSRGEVRERALSPRTILRALTMEGSAFHAAAR